jgi:serine O-acetyltransferase
MAVIQEDIKGLQVPLQEDAPAGTTRRRAGCLTLIRQDIACVFERDPAARTLLEVVTTYPGVHAIAVYRLAHPLWCRGWKYAARLLSYIARIWTSIDIHPGARIGPRFFIDHGAGVVIGETAEVGRDVTLYHGVTLGGTTWNKGKRHPTLGDGVVVGAGAKVLGPITLGSGAKVGANSVVIRDVPDNQTVVGIPGKIVRVDRVASDSPHGIDLNHHLIPDPVAGAIACLLDRIRLLEKELGLHGCVPGGETIEDECDDCEARQVCETESPRPVRDDNMTAQARGEA